MDDTNESDDSEEEIVDETPDLPSDIRRTVIAIHKTTVEGQDLLITGGIPDKE